MKKYIVNKTINYILTKNKCTSEEIDIIRYGLSNVYLQITKLLVISSIAIYLNLFTPFLIFIIFFNFIRAFSFGMHAKKSWQCWISSIIIFIGIPFLMTHISVPILIKQIVCILLVLLIYKNSPSDTEKRPIISFKRRNIYKFLSTIIAISYAFLILYLKNNILTNALLFSLLLQSIIISPITYKLFGLTYNNYKYYGKEDIYVC